MTTEEKVALLEKAIPETHTLLDVLDACEAGEAQLWVEDEAIIVTEIQEYPRQKILHFWLAGGDFDAVVAMEDKIFEWGREQGCTKATLAGRKGWERALKDRGWAPELRVVGKEL